MIDSCNMITTIIQKPTKNPNHFTFAVLLLDHDKTEQKNLDKHFLL